ERQSPPRTPPAERGRSEDISSKISHQRYLIEDISSKKGSLIRDPFEEEAARRWGIEQPRRGERRKKFGQAEAARAAAPIRMAPCKIPMRRWSAASASRVARMPARSRTASRSARTAWS